MDDNEKLKKLVLDKINLENTIKKQKELISNLQKEKDEYKKEIDQKYKSKVETFKNKMQSLKINMINEIKENLEKNIVDQLNKKYEEILENELQKVNEYLNNRLKDMQYKMEETLKQKLEKIEKDKNSLNQNCEKNNLLQKKHKGNSINIENIKNGYNNRQENDISINGKKSFKENMKKSNCSNENKIVYDKNNNNIKDINNLNSSFNSNINLKTIYSYECLNIKELSTSVDIDIKETMISLKLKNNGEQAWPENSTKIIFDGKSNIFGDEIILNPQKPNEEEEYFMLFKELDKYPEGDYKAYLRFCVNDSIFGEKIFVKIIIKEKNEGI